MTLTKLKLIKRISRETGMGRPLVCEMINKTFDYISEALASGDKVELRNFGVFDVIIRNPRIARNPKQPANAMLIPARAAVKFKPGKQMRHEVFQLSPKTISTKNPLPPSGNGIT